MPNDIVIDKETLFQKIGYDPHKHQWSIHNSVARFRIPCCGRRFGKSQAAGHEITARMFVPNTYNWIIGPTYALGEKEFRVVYDDLVRKLKLGSKIKKQYNVNQGNMRIEMPWNTILEVKSAEKKDGLVGEGLDFACMSEAARHDMDTWNAFIEPALSDKRGGAIFPSTPKGYNWYYGLWQIGQDPRHKDYDSWRMPSWYNTKMYPGGLDDPEMQRIKNNIVSDQFWKQEYAAEFTTFEGQIYDEFDENIHVRKLDYVPMWRNYLVFDFGFADPLVALDIMVDQSDNVYVWREYQVRYKSTFEHASIIKNRTNPEGYHINAMFADPRGADEIATLALVLGQCFANSVGWTLGVEAVKRHLKVQPDGQPKLFIDPSCMDLIRQMKQLRVPNMREGHNAKTGQHDHDDHGPDALRYFFNEFFVLGSGSSLADVYDGAYRGSEAAGFFTQTTQLKLTGDIGYR